MEAQIQESNEQFPWGDREEIAHPRARTAAGSESLSPCVLDVLVDMSVYPPHIGHQCQLSFHTTLPLPLVVQYCRGVFLYQLLVKIKNCSFTC